MHFCNPYVSHEMAIRDLLCHWSGLGLGERTPKAVGDLEHWQYDSFKMRWRNQTIEYAL
jgi:hypothetical protein